MKVSAIFPTEKKQHGAHVAYKTIRRVAICPRFHNLPYVRCSIQSLKISGRSFAKFILKLKQMLAGTRPRLRDYNTARAIAAPPS